MVVSLNYCSQNGGDLFRAPYYNGNPNIGPRIIGEFRPIPMYWGPKKRELKGFIAHAGSL